MTTLIAHLAFTTKYRHKLFDGSMMQQLRNHSRVPVKSWDINGKRVRLCASSGRLLTKAGNQYYSKQPEIYIIKASANLQ